jgi:hypothetical protein
VRDPVKRVSELLVVEGRAIGGEGIAQTSGGD